VGRGWGGDRHRRSQRPRPVGEESAWWATQAWGRARVAAVCIGGGYGRGGRVRETTRRGGELGWWRRVRATAMAGVGMGDG
jgi:hypothetical protein